MYALQCFKNVVKYALTQIALFLPIGGARIGLEPVCRVRGT